MIPTTPDYCPPDLISSCMNSSSIPVTNALCLCSQNTNFPGRNGFEWVPSEMYGAEDPSDILRGMRNWFASFDIHPPPERGLVTPQYGLYYVFSLRISVLRKVITFGYNPSA